MDILHITPSENIKSIMGSKIFRRKPILSVFDNIMENEYGPDYDKKKGLVFGFPESITNRDKIIKDFAYWKTWGQPRNVFLLKYDDKEYEELQEKGVKIFLHIKPKSTYFSILLLDIQYEQLFDVYIHQQSADMSPLWVDMDARYEHNDKPLVLINYDIEAIKIKSIIGTVQSIVTKEYKINTLLHI